LTVVDRVEVDPAALEHAAGLSEGLSKKVRGIVGDLRGNLDSIEYPETNQPWGDDKMGRKFVDGKNQDGYTSARTNLLDGGTGMANTLGEFATGQRDAVNQLRGTDQDSAGTF
jgi:uncharacterized protein YukE